MRQAFFLCSLTTPPGDAPEGARPAPELAAPAASWVMLAEAGEQALVHCLLFDQAEPASDPAYLGSSYAELWRARPDLAKTVLWVQRDEGPLSLAQLEADGQDFELSEARPPHQWAGMGAEMP